MSERFTFSAAMKTNYQHAVLSTLPGQGICELNCKKSEPKRQCVLNNADFVTEPTRDTIIINSISPNPKKQIPAKCDECNF